MQLSNCYLPRTESFGSVLYSISNLIHSLRELNCHIRMFTTLMLCYVLYNLVESGKKGKKGDLKKEGLER